MGKGGSFGSCNSLTGIKRRTRQCNNPKPLNGGANCPGYYYQDISCPVDGGWGSWGSWKRCGQGVQSTERTRQCNKPKPLNGGSQCTGSSIEKRTCPGPLAYWMIC